MKTVLLLSLATLIPFAAQAERFEAGNSPSVFKKLAGTEMILTFKQLPINGTQLDDRYGWSETYWPSNVGGIAYRWSHPNPEPFKYKLNSKEELKIVGRKFFSTSPRKQLTTFLLKMFGRE